MERSAIDVQSALRQRQLTHCPTFTPSEVLTAIHVFVSGFYSKNSPFLESNERDNKNQFWSSS